MNIKHVINLLLLTFITGCVFAQPNITSFNPSAAAIGSTITIQGSNFSSVAENNLVYFGAVKAPVITASDSILTVKLPVGAGYQYITVTTNGLTARSSLPFTVTFNSADTAYSQLSFDSQMDYYTGVAPEACTIADIDGDGKPEIIVANHGSDFVSVFKNNSNVGSVSLAAKKDFETGIGSFRVSYGDFDGDGKYDLIVVNKDSSRVSILKNTSTTDAISFAPRIDLLSGNAPRDLVISDFDGDGKLDVVVSINATSVSIYKNTSSAGAISFTSIPALSLSGGGVSGSAFGIASGDVDGDHKPDLVLARTSGYFSILRNTSTAGNISFASILNFATSSMSSSPRGISLADIDGDSKLDIAVTDQLNYPGPSPALLLFRNKSSIGAISCDTMIRYTTNSGKPGLSIDNVDGDDKPDIILANTINRESITAFKNKSASGNILLKPKIEFPVNGQVSEYVKTGDIDGDGKPDLIIVERASNKIGIFRNKMAEANPLCPHGNTAFTANFVGNSYQWQVSVDSVNFTNVSNSDKYGGATTATLQLNSVPSNFYSYKFRCLVDGISSSVYTLRFSNSWTGAVDTAWENNANWSCGAVPDSNTNVIINSGTVVLSSNAFIQSLMLNPSVKFNVVTGVTLTISR